MKLLRNDILEYIVNYQNIRKYNNEIKYIGVVISNMPKIKIRNLKEKKCVGTYFETIIDKKRNIQKTVSKFDIIIMVIFIWFP